MVAAKKMAKTNAELAQALGMHPTSISNMAKHSAWNFQAPYSVQEIQKWRSEHIDSAKSRFRGGKSEELNRLRMAVLRETARKKRLESNVLEGRYVERILVDRVLRAYVNMVKAKIGEWCESLPPQMEGMTITEMRGLLTGVYDQLCKDMYQVAVVTPASESEMKDEKKLKPRSYGGRPKKKERKKT